MPREICPKCNYPLKTCVCRFITPVTHKTKIVVLQHPSEVDNKKNTIRVLSLISDNIQIIVGENEDDFAQIKSLLTQPNINCFLLYPSEQSKIWSEYLIEDNDPNESEQKNRENVLIVLDGTWRKAKKIHLCNPWLNNLPNLTLETTKKTNYSIRKSNLEFGLSSIEAIAYILEDIENISPAPFLTALNGLKTAFTRLMPSSVKQRYDS